MIEQFNRMKAALAILARNLGGEGLEALKPISVGFAQQMAEMARAAYFHEPHEYLDRLIASGTDIPEAGGKDD